MRLQDIAEKIYGDALCRARPPVLPFQQAASLEELAQDPAFLGRLKIGLAEGVARALAANDERVLAVHVFAESGCDGDCEEASRPLAVHLLILVEGRSAALEALATALDETLTDTVRALPMQIQGRHGSLLNPIFITREDVAGRQGYAFLLSSTNTTLIPVWTWQQEAEQTAVS
jgi:hypothetical protein